MRKLVILLALLCIPPLVNGCGRRHVIRHHGPGPVVAVTWMEVRGSIWVDYYGCDDESIHYLSGLDEYDDGDLFVLLWISFWSDFPIRHVIHVYETECRGNLYEAFVYYRVPVADFYIDLPNGTRAPPPYGKAYGYYWNRHQKPRHKLNNKEFHALAHLRIATGHYGFTPREYFNRYERARGKTKHPFRHVVRTNANRAGKGGFNSQGKPRKVKPGKPREKTAPKPEARPIPKPKKPEARPTPKPKKPEAKPKPIPSHRPEEKPKPDHGKKKDDDKKKGKGKKKDDDR